MRSSPWMFGTQKAENDRYKYQWGGRCRALPHKPFWMHTSSFMQEPALHAARIIDETTSPEVAWWALSLNIWHLKEQIQRSHIWYFFFLPVPIQTPPDFIGVKEQDWNLSSGHSVLQNSLTVLRENRHDCKWEPWDLARRSYRINKSIAFFCWHCILEEKMLYNDLTQKGPRQFLLQVSLFLAVAGWGWPISTDFATPIALLRTFQCVNQLLCSGHFNVLINHLGGFLQCWSLLRPYLYSTRGHRKPREAL